MSEQDEREQGHAEVLQLRNRVRWVLTKFFQDPLGFALNYMIYIILVGLALSLMIGVTRGMLLALFIR